MARIRGEDITFSRYQMALVALVFGHREGRISRADVAWLIWEEDDGPGPRHKLRQLLVDVRKRLDLRVIDSMADPLEPDRSAAACDLEGLLDSLAAGRFAEAATTLSRGFATAINSPPSPAFADWLEGRRVSLERRVRRESADAWDERVRANAWPSALDAAEALYLIAPDDVPTLEKVIEARARTGRTASADAAYADHLASLTPGVKPAARLVELMARVGALGGETVSDRPAVPNVPLIGRTSQLAEARKVLESVRSGRLDLLFVSGEAGIGKTRFLEEVRTEAVLKGFTCLHAQSVELEQRIALNPIIDALSGLDLRPHLRALGDPWRPVISSFLPASAIDGPAGDIPYIQDSGLSRRLLDAFWMLFDRIAQEAPTLLFLDDMHWADPTTIALVQFMQRRWDSGVLGIVGATRPELLRKDDPLSMLMQESEGANLSTVHLSELHDSDARKLVDHVADRPLDETTGRHLCDLAANHPFYLTEVTRDFVAGRLTLPERTLETIPIPVSLRQIFDARIEHLSEGALRVAELLAVRARPIRLVEIGRLAELALDHCADRVEELQRWSFVAVNRDQVGISHELFRSAIYKHLGEVRRSMLHGRVAGFLEDLEGSDLAGELAIHFAEAGQAERAVHHAGIAATEALASGAVTAAIQFYEIVVENESDPHLRASGTADLARALHMNRQIHRANPMLELAATRLRVTGDEWTARRMDILRVEGLSEGGATPVPDLIDRLARVKVEASVAKDWEVLALALDVELHLRHRQGDVPGIRTVLNEMETVVGAGSNEAACLSNAGLGLGILFRDSDDGVARGERAVAIARRHALTHLLLRAQCRLIAVHEYSARLYLPASQRLVQEARVSADRAGDRFLRCTIEANVAVFQLDVGDLDLAEESLGRAGPLLSGADLQHLSMNHRVNHGELALLKGNYSEAEIRYRGLRESLDSNPTAHLTNIVHAGLGLCAVEQGRLWDARRYEEQLEKPDYWYYEPSLILRFRATLLVRRGLHEAAVDLLREDQPQLFPRMVNAWLKIRVLELELAARVGAAIPMERVEEAREIAHGLRLRTRATWLDRLRERLR